MYSPASPLSQLLDSGLPVIEFGRDICCSELALKKEWLITNGLGGYASATISGALTRRYHGLLIAALQPPLQRTILLSKLDEAVQCSEGQVPLYANIWNNGTISPQGHMQLDSFRIVGRTPVWYFQVGDIEIIKTILLIPDENTVLSYYEYRHGKSPLPMHIKVIVNNRSHHQVHQQPNTQFQIKQTDFNIFLNDQSGISFRVLANNFQIEKVDRWIRDYFYPVEAYRGLEALDDHYHAVNLFCELTPGSGCAVIASTEMSKEFDPETIFQTRIAYETKLLQHGKNTFIPTRYPPQQVIQKPFEQLLLAADQFIVRRVTKNALDGSTIIAGYPWFSDWGRDTMISLTGLTLLTGRHSDAKKILQTFAQFINLGMIPNRFPNASDLPEYNTVDATLWYFQAIYEYFQVTRDLDFIRELYQTLAKIISWHVEGTRYHIKMDAQDGLIYAGEPGIQLTWMDAKVGDWVVTARTGKPVEVNALWYNALAIMTKFSAMVGENQELFDNYAKNTLSNFNKFWNSELNYCFDVIDGPEGSDGKLRPNQIFTVSLPHSPLSRDQQIKVVDIVEKHLLTPFGLRSLSPNEPEYIGIYGGNQRQRDAAYHQGTVWGWLIGPFVTAWLRVYRNPDRAVEFLAPLIRHLNDHGIGSLSEIFEGDPPYKPRGCFAQAWSVAEVIHAWHEIAEFSFDSMQIQKD